MNGECPWNIVYIRLNPSKTGGGVVVEEQVINGFPQDTINRRERKITADELATIHRNFEGKLVYLPLPINSRFRETDQGGCQICIYREERICYKLYCETDLTHICRNFKGEVA